LTYSRSVKVLISVDMEGISGVTTGRETATRWPAGAAKRNDTSAREAGCLLLPKRHLGHYRNYRGRRT
jgi:hypothetical protein